MRYGDHTVREAAIRAETVNRSSLHEELAMKLSNRTARAMLPVAIALLPLVLSTASSVADARERQVTRTGPNGQSAQRLTSRQRTGDTFTRNRTTTGPRGNTSSTNATTTRTDDGATRSVTHTGVKGGETQVNSSIARTDDGYVKERSITGPNGNTAKRSSDVGYDPATRTLDRNSVTTGPKGNSVTTDATTTRTEEGYQREVTRTGPNGTTTRQTEVTSAPK